MVKKLADLVNPALNDGSLTLGDGTERFLFQTTPGSRFKFPQ